MSGSVTSERPDRLSDPTVPVTGTTPRVASWCGSSDLSDPLLFAFLAVRSELVGRVLRGYRPACARDFAQEFPQTFGPTGSSTESGSALHRSAGSPQVPAQVSAQAVPSSSETRAVTSRRPRVTVRQARACATAPGCRRARTASRPRPPAATALPAIRSASSSTAPGRSRGSSRPSSAYPRSGKPSSSVDPAQVRRPRDEQPPAHAQHRQRARARQHRGGLLLVVEHPVVERAVRLEVAHLGAGRDARSRTARRPGRRPARAARRRRRRGPPARSWGGRRRRPGRRRETPSRAASSQTERMICALPAW